MEWITQILQGYGLQGVVIFALGYTVWWQNKNSVEVNNNRLSERDVLIKALEGNTTALRENAKATENGNEITQDLADAIAKQVAAFEMFLVKSEIQQGSMKEAINKQDFVINALAEANRTNTGILTDIRNKVANT